MSAKKLKTKHEIASDLALSGKATATAIRDDDEGPLNLRTSARKSNSKQECRFTNMTLATCFRDILDRQPEPNRFIEEILRDIGVQLPEDGITDVAVSSFGESKVAVLISYSEYDKPDTPEYRHHVQLMLTQGPSIAVKS